MAQPQRIRQWLSARTIATLAVFSILAACTPGGRDARPGQAGPPKPVEKPTGPDEADRQKVAVLVPPTGPNAALGHSTANAAHLALLDFGHRLVPLTVYHQVAGGQRPPPRRPREGTQ